MRVAVRAFILTGLVVALTSLMSHGQSAVKDQKKDLERIQSDVKRSKQRLDSLKREEGRVQQELSEADQRINSQQSLIGKLGTQLSQLQREIAMGESQLTDREQGLERAKGRYLGSVRGLYMTMPRQPGSFVESPTAEVEAKKRVTYLAALVSYEAGSVTEATDYLSEARSQLDELAGRQSKIERMKQKREANFALEQARRARRQKQLSRLRRMKTKEFDRIVMLQQSAEEMERILTRLESAPRTEKHQRVTISRTQTSGSFSVLKGGLPEPFKGEIVIAYGSATDPTTHLKSFSPGISVRGKPNSPVVSVGTGVVAYTGNLRGYGDFVIIDHDGQYFTTYAGLGQTSVSTGQEIGAGDRVGLSDQSGIVRFELRKGRQALDPMDWIRSDAY